MRREPVLITKDAHIQKLLQDFMGKNTPERQKFIIENLVVEKDIVEAV
jgi:topoisomerase IV subunit B